MTLNRSPLKPTERNQSDEIMGRLRQIYIESGMTITDIAEKSVELVGQRVSLDTLFFISKTHNWQAARAQARSNGDDAGPGQDEQIAYIKDALFREIVRQSEGGLFITLHGTEAQEVKDRLADLNLDIIESGSGLDPSLVRAYFDALAKLRQAGISGGASAKTSRQRALELRQRAAEELESDGYQS